MICDKNWLKSFLSWKDLSRHFTFCFDLLSKPSTGTGSVARGSGQGSACVQQFYYRVGWVSMGNFLCLLLFQLFLTSPLAYLLLLPFCVIRNTYPSIFIRQDNDKLSCITSIPFPAHVIYQMKIEK